MTPLATILILSISLLSAMAIMGWVAYAIVRRVADSRQKQALLQMKLDERRETLRTVTPIRLQAYERMALFLERISPSSLVLRCYQPGMDLRLLQGVMTKNIRDEWEHNLSQQVYLSSEVWTVIRQAKDEMINLVNSTGAVLDPTTDPSTLAANIFATATKNGTPTDLALDSLKAELRQLYA
ncbi:MAG: hypothetical protein IJ789_08190 [Bacteroidales bacterium]|nr:hypothetical protein [Bacteroidales bacterium]